MEKKFSRIEIATIKRTAQNVAQFVNKKEKFLEELAKVRASKEEMVKKMMEEIEAKAEAKIAKKVEKLQGEIDYLQPLIDAYQLPVKNLTGGYTTEDLVQREVVKTGKFDPKTGKEIVTTRFVLKYPDTVVPPAFDGKDNEQIGDVEFEEPADEFEEETLEEPVEVPDNELADIWGE